MLILTIEVDAPEDMTQGYKEAFMSEFAKRLQSMREKQRKSRRVLSELCGLPSDAVRRYERGEVRVEKIEMGSLIAIAEYFEVSLDYLVGRTDDPQINSKNKPKR